MVVWSHFLHQKRFRQQLRELLPHDPTDVALGHVGGILCGADKLSRMARLQSDPAVAEVLGIEAVASPSALSRFFDVFTQRICQGLSGLHRHSPKNAPSSVPLPTALGGSTAGASQPASASARTAKSLSDPNASPLTPHPVPPSSAAYAQMATSITSATLPTPQPNQRFSCTARSSDSHPVHF